MIVTIIYMVIHFELTFIFNSIQCIIYCIIKNKNIIKNYD